MTARPMELTARGRRHRPRPPKSSRDTAQSGARSDQMPPPPPPPPPPTPNPTRRRPSALMGPLEGALAAAVLLALLLAHLATPAEAVDCFKCSSRNGSNPACEDPFHNMNTTRVTLPILPEPQPSVIYHTPCYAGRKNRDGLFPASACIKLTGVFDTTGETLVVRHCALDSGSLTQDTELARMSHCGKFQFEGDLLRGCVLACPEDACNSAPSLSERSAALVWLSAAWPLGLLAARLLRGLGGPLAIGAGGC